MRSITIALLCAMPVAAGFSGTITYTYANGILLGAPQVSAPRSAGLAPRAQPAAGTFTAHHGHRYSARVTLGFPQSLASNEMVASYVAQYGFTNVVVTGSGSVRQGLATWPGPDTTVTLDPRLSDIKDLGSISVA